MSEMIWRTRHERSEKAAQVLMERRPAVASLLLWAKHLDTPKDLEGPMMTAATDGKRIFYGEDFAKRPLNQQAFIVAHEVMHIALCHPTRAKRMWKREGPTYSPSIWNVACDMLINDGLMAQRFLEAPPDVITRDKVEEMLKKNKYKGPALKTESFDVETLYQLIKQYCPTIKINVM